MQLNFLSNNLLKIKSTKILKAAEAQAECAQKILTHTQCALKFFSPNSTYL